MCTKWGFFFPPLDGFLRRMAQKWDDCLKLSCFEEGETMSGLIFLLPPTWGLLLSSLTPLWGVVTVGGRRGSGLSQIVILCSTSPSHSTQRYSSSPICDIKCGVPSKAICISTVAETLSQRETGRMVPDEAIES